MSSIEELKRKNKVIERAIDEERAESLRLAEEKELLLRRSRTGIGRMDLVHREFSDEEKKQMADLKIRSTSLAEVIETVYAENGVDINDPQVWRYVSKDETLPLDMRGKKDNARP